MIAHIRKTDGKQQDWREHSRNVASLCFQAVKAMGYGTLAKLTGLIHDFGKGTKDFQEYLLGTGSQHPNHAALGALYVWRRWGETDSFRRKRTAQIIALCIYGHHAGLPDCLDESGKSPFLERLGEESEQYYGEAMENFHKDVVTEDEVDELFEKACEETEKYALGKESFSWGLFTRLLLSVLVDADRWDSACFENGADPFISYRKMDRMPEWENLLNTMEWNLQRFSSDGNLAKIRGNISDACKRAAVRKQGIYTLSVPTGAGKTFSSLRFALSHAQKNQMKRIFYIIPMNTILDQNAKDIREILNGYESILEHHSSVVLEDEQDEDEYRRLTERWDSDIILTSLVQFLEALFKHGNGRARRMYRLTNSVLIFDEVQALPKKCRGLFQRAIEFLVKYCHSTVVLCTATQPNFKLKAETLVPGAESIQRQMKRVEYIPELTNRTYQEAADDIADLVHERNSVLTIVNTKDAAWNVYQRLSQNLQMCGYTIKEIKTGYTEEELAFLANQSKDHEILCVHLSTMMCPAHRKEIIRWIKTWLAQGKRVCCVSTALIEAGINVSFPVVVRSLAGMPSIIQAAGRCNRNFEDDVGTVLLWKLSEENLKNLPDIQKGREISDSLLRETEVDEEFSESKIVKKYFEKEEPYIQAVENYPYKPWNSDLVSMLSKNDECVIASKSLRDSPLDDLSKRLRQSFRTAGTEFCVIDQQTKSVLVPYGDGKELMEKFSDSHSMEEEIQWLKEAQQYSVNLFDQIYTRLAKEGALLQLGEKGVVALREEYYDDFSGVLTTPAEMKLLNY